MIRTIKIKVEFKKRNFFRFTKTIAVKKFNCSNFNKLCEMEEKFELNGYEVTVNAGVRRAFKGKEFKMVSNVKSQLSQVFIPFNTWLDKHAESIKSGQPVDPQSILVDIKPDIYLEESQLMLVKLYLEKNEK